MISGDKSIHKENCITFEICGVKPKSDGNSFQFHDNAMCEIVSNPFIKRIAVCKNIDHVSFYLKDSLVISDANCSQIVNYLYSFLGSMMISLLKNSLPYQSVPLMPTICLSSIRILGENNQNHIELRDNLGLHDSLSIQINLNGNDILSKWLQDVDVPLYSNKEDRYDILFLLLRGSNPIQKYMALYAYLMSLVQILHSCEKEGQKQVVKYIKDNCSRVAITLHQSPSTRPGAKTTDYDDQFTALRNKIGHPNIQNKPVDVSDNAINGLASIICCAIEDLPL